MEKPKDDQASAPVDINSLAEAGDHAALCNLAILYELGLDCPQDLGKAQELWQKAAALGSLHAIAKTGETALDETDLSVSSASQLSSEFGNQPATAERVQRVAPVKVILPKILVIESDLDALEACVETLDFDEHNVTGVPSATEGLKFIMQNQDIRSIYCNIRLSDMNGLQFVKTLRKMQVAGSARIVIGSATTTKELIQKAKTLGVDAWLAIPFTEENFAETLTKF